MKFSYLEKSKFDSVCSTLFKILANNMDKIAPTGHPREEDYKVWYADVSEKVKDDKFNIVLATDDNDEIAGFFEFHTTDDTFVMDEIQISPAFHGKGNVFRNIHGFVFENIGYDYKFVEAAANKLNSKSIGVLGTLGLKPVGELHNGSCLLLRGDFSDLLKWYNK